MSVSFPEFAGRRPWFGSSVIASPVILTMVAAAIGLNMGTASAGSDLAGFRQVAAMPSAPGSVIGRHGLAVPVVVYGEDDRQPVGAESRAARAIGMIEVVGRDAAMGTGALISPRLVLTAANVLYRYGDEYPNEYYFTADFDPDRPGQGLRRKIVRVFAGTTKPDLLTSGRPANMAKDWVIGVLEEPMPPLWPYFEIGQPTLEELRGLRGGITVFGYRGWADEDIGPLAVHRACDVQRINTRQMLRINCDTSHYSAGAPVLRVVDGTFEIIGVSTRALPRPAALNEEKRTELRYGADAVTIAVQADQFRLMAKRLIEQYP